MASGYRRVNYYELCRLCTSSEGTKIHIFREEGRRRQLSTKIKLCLPFQINEDDSLPKIICNCCADKLETFYEFRNACVNSEAMLEGYFTSSQYSEDFIREGKVYVKDGSSQKKKSLEEDKSPLKVSNVHTAIPVRMDLNNLVPGTPIQIHMQPTAGMLESPVRFAYQPPGNVVSTSGSSTNIALTAAIQSDYKKNLNKAEISQNHKQIDPGSTTFYVRVPNRVEEGTMTVHGEGGEATEVDTALRQTITFTPSHGQDMLVHFDFNKDNKEQNNTSTILGAEDRESIEQIGEFLEMKAVVVEEPNDQITSCCDQCGLELNTPELQESHAIGCPEMVEEKAGGHFSCENCGKQFKRKEHLFQHRKLHTGERPYVCTTCHKAFSRKEHLVRHCMAHTGQRQHACELCTKTFSRKDNLYKHRKTHGITGPYECETCGKSFVVKHYYLMHRNSHATPDSSEDSLPFRCDICHKGFSVKQYLNTHKLRHRTKPPQVVVERTSDEQEHPESLSTVNTAAINITHHNNSNPQMFQIAGSNATYIATSTSNVLVNNYRR